MVINWWWQIQWPCGHWPMFLAENMAQTLRRGFTMKYLGCFYSKSSVIILYMVVLNDSFFFWWYFPIHLANPFSISTMHLDSQEIWPSLSMQGCHKWYGITISFIMSHCLHISIGHWRLLIEVSSLCRQIPWKIESCMIQPCRWVAIWAVCWKTDGAAQNQPNKCIKGVSEEMEQD